MLFKDYHIPMIRSGSKTVTRREWKENYHGPNVGTVVAAKTELLKPDAECDCFIKITGKRKEPLGEISEESARREGEYDGVEDFREGYEDVYGDGSWEPEKVVTVVEFEYVGEQRPSDGGTDQSTLLTDGGDRARDGELRIYCPNHGDLGSVGSEERGHQLMTRHCRIFACPRREMSFTGGSHAES